MNFLTEVRCDDCGKFLCYISGDDIRTTVCEECYKRTLKKEYKTARKTMEELGFNLKELDNEGEDQMSDDFIMPPKKREKGFFISMPIEKYKKKIIIEFLEEQSPYQEVGLILRCLKESEE